MDSPSMDDWQRLRVAMGRFGDKVDPCPQRSPVTPISISCENELDFCGAELYIPVVVGANGDQLVSPRDARH